VVYVKRIGPEDFMYVVCSLCWIWCLGRITQ